MVNKRIVILTSIIAVSLGILFIATNSTDIYAQINQTGQNISNSIINSSNNQTQANQTTLTPAASLLPSTNQTLEEKNQRIDQQDQVNVTEFLELANTAVSRISENNTKQAQQIISEVEQNLNTTAR